MLLLCLFLLACPTFALRDRVWMAASRRHPSSLSLAAFAGGFGSKSGLSAATSKKGNKKRKRGLLDQDILANQQQQQQKSSSSPQSVVVDEPVLDKWGLPPPTETDIFPLLPPGTELLPVAPQKQYGLAQILQALESRMALPGLALHFDEAGVEKRPPPGQVPVRLQLVHESPPVLVLDHFLTAEECDEITRIAMPDQSNQSKEASDTFNYSDPIQVNSATFSTLAQSKRTSTSWFCPYAAVPTLLAKAQHLLGVNVNTMEEPQIVQYKTGQEFSWHYDEVPANQLLNGGQRVGTFLVYLNDVARGGGTVFRDLRDSSDEQPLTVQPRQGRVCLFFPADGQGRPDDRTLHKGQIAEDEKRIIQIWFHQRFYRASLPADNRQEDAIPAMERASQRLGYAPADKT